MADNIPVSVPATVPAVVNNGADFTWTPSTGSKPTDTARVAAVQYEDGYEEAAVYGINSVYRSWDLVFTLIDGDSLQPIIDFLTGKAGMPFSWVQPWPAAQTLLMWTCRSWQANYEDGGGRLMGLTCTFKQAFIPV